MSRYLTTIAAVVITALLVTAWFLYRESELLDQVAASEVKRIEAEIAKGAPLVRVVPGPVRVLERERIVVQQVAPKAEPIVAAEIHSEGETQGAPQLKCPDASVVQCPDPLTGCETHITGWRTEAGNVVATGTQTRWWQWPGKERQDSTVDLTTKNTKVTADPRLLVTDSAPRWLAGALAGLDSHGTPRYGVVIGRRLVSRRGVDLHAVAVGMVGGGDVVVTAGLAAGW